MTSGVPQGSVLESTLFLIYIIDLPGHVNCKVSLFADDTLMYQTVNTAADRTVFQSNITSLSTRADTWCVSSMLQNAQSCASIRNHLHLLVRPNLKLHKENKYLGVIIQSDLKFTTHIKQKVARAKQQLGIIKRALHGAIKKTKLLAYSTLCRPLVEYASSVWDPVLEYRIYDIEMV